MSRLRIIHNLIWVLLWHTGICQDELHSDVRFTKLYNCNATRSKWLFQNLSISYFYPKSYIKADLNITSETREIKKAILHFDRCIDEGYKCENFQTWNLENVCPYLLLGNQIWNGFYDSLHPPLRCPIKKMIYQIRNATFDFEDLRRWYPDIVKYHWIINFKAWDEQNDIIFCGGFETHVYQYITKRKRKRKSSI